MTDSELALTRQTTHESVADRIRLLILGGRLKPGQRIKQDEIASKLGVSRTPVREALHKLNSEGLITLSAHKGASVVNFSPADLEQIYTIRIALEGYASYLAAQRISDGEIGQLEENLELMKGVLKRGDRLKLLELNRKFHIGIYAAADQPRLYDLITKYFDLADVYRRIFVSLEHGPEELVNHREVLVALRRRDAVMAEQLTRTHLEKTLAALLAFFRAHPDGVIALEG